MRCCSWDCDVLWTRGRQLGSTGSVQRVLRRRQRKRLNDCLHWVPTSTPLADPRGAMDARPPGSNSFISMQFSAQICRIAPTWEWQEILDPPLSAATTLALKVNLGLQPILGWNTRCIKKSIRSDIVSGVADKSLTLSANWRQQGHWRIWGRWRTLPIYGPRFSRLHYPWYKNNY